MSKKIKILIVDDSEVVRQSLKSILLADEEFEIMAMANDPYEAVQELRKGVPDVITLDVEMPRMDGITFLQKIMKQHPIPVVVISTLTKRGTNEAVKALEFGAVEVMHKPNVTTGKELERNAEYIRNAIKAASMANISNLKKQSIIAQKRAITVNHRSNEYVIPKQTESPASSIIAIGASTGGTEAIKVILKSLEPGCPGVVIVQHMPVLFTGQFAQRLNNECTIQVKEAVNGEQIQSGLALISPGDKHMIVKRKGLKMYVELTDSELVNRHKPSVDVLFNSVAETVKSRALGVLLTGMGKDGAKGLLNMKNSGANTIAQDEASCVVFGMPKEAILIGAASKVMNLEEIGDNLKKLKN